MSPQLVKELVRHGGFETASRRYVHLRLEGTAAAMGSMPRLPDPTEEC